jgi:iron(III) transport system ATP-binding protein
VPTSGRILLDHTVFYDGGRRLVVPPERRNCGLVFQSYALWPHMTVERNLAFPLDIRKVRKSEQQERIMNALQLVEMEAYVDRYPHELSGGQQQRVALARTLVYEPRLLLLDEPLSNLDAKLRHRARRWLKDLQRRLAVTTIYVTHDQAEALSLSDRIAVMNMGRLEQVGTPEQIYRNPVNSFVADFIGASNFLDGTVTSSGDGQVVVDIGSGMALRATSRESLDAGCAVRVALRPEDIRFVRNGEAVPRQHNVVSGEITGRDYLGARFQYVLNLLGAEVRIEVEDDLRPGETSIAFSPDSCIAFACNGRAVR